MRIDRRLNPLRLVNSVGQLKHMLGGRGEVFVAAALTIALVAACERHRTPCVYEVGEHYRGWILVEFGRPDCPAIPLENGKLVFRLTDTGELCTKSPTEYGWAKDEFYFVGAGGRRSIEDARNDSTVEDESRLVHSGVVAGWGNSTFMCFFIGTGEEYKRAPSLQDVLEKRHPAPAKRRTGVNGRVDS